MLRSARFVVSEPVRAALAGNRGVVALESTVITHGLPFPNNLETAQALENEVRSAGCEPATIALLNGKIHVGLTSSQLAQVADTMDSVKVSRRDISHALVQNVVGGTTVAATMYLAHQAGIRVFSTGGIGGVHRGADQTFDVSADLLELAQTPVVVVCAGVKSILDIPKTVEFLETHSVNTIVFGEKNEFPGFFTRSSGVRGQFSTKDLDEVAAVIQMSEGLGLPAGTILACPIPKEFQADGQEIEDAVQEALRRAEKQGIRSQGITPFILKTVNEITKGASMKTNIALLMNNARIGAQLAKKLTKESHKPVISGRKFAGVDLPQNPKVSVVGATIVDLEAVTQSEIKNDGGSYEGFVFQRCGGVARNHADALTRLGCDVSFISAVGQDSHAQFFFDSCRHMDLSRVAQIKEVPTAVYTSVNVKGNIQYGISSIGKIVDRISPEMVSRHEDAICDSEYVVIDGNIPTETIGKTVELAAKRNVPIWFDPTDYHKARKIIDCGLFHKVTAVSPNSNEFRMMAKRLGIDIPEAVFESPERMAEFVESHPAVMASLEILLVSMAEKGIAAFTRKDGCISSICLPPPTDSRRIVSASGAGDCLNSGIISSLLRGFSWEESLRRGNQCAALSLASTDAVPSNLSQIFSQ